MDRVLRQFLTIAEVGGITKAARVLHISQPTLTFNLKKLEASLGVELFVRGATGMELTSYGEILRDHARLMQRLNENAEINIQSLKLQNARALRIGCGFAWWVHFVKDMIDNYVADYPQAPMHIDVGSQLHGMEHLLSGDIELIVAHRFESLNPRMGVEFKPMFEVKDAYFVRSQHPLIRKRCTIEELDAYTFIDTVPFEIRHKQIQDKREEPLSPSASLNRTRRTLTSNSFSACIDLIISSDGIMRYPVVMKDYLASFGIAPLDITGIPAKSVGIYQLTEYRDDPRIADIIDRLEATARLKLPNLYLGAN